MFSYPVTLTPEEEGGFTVTFPDVPEAITQGESREEALKWAREALETALQIYIDTGRPFPRPSEPKKGQHVVSVEIPQHANQQNHSI